MGSQQLYNLSWGEFGSSLTSTVQTLRDHDEMVDVTLTAGGRIFSAHKLVLCAASPLLKDLLKSTHCHHPVLMLAGIMAHDLEALLHFMYQGEVSVDSTQLPSLLQAAHCLNIQALSPQTLTAQKTMTHLPDPVVLTDSVHDNTNTISSSRNISCQPQTSRDLPSLLPVRKRKRKQSQSSETDSVKWGVSEVGGVALESQQIDQVVDSRIDESKDGMIDDQQCNGEPNSPSLPEVKLRYASEQPCLCSLCGMVIRQARNLRRHLLTSCPSRPVIECQIETSEINFPKIEIPNESQNESLHRQSSISPEFGLTCEPAVPKSPEYESATSDSNKVT